MKRLAALILSLIIPLTFASCDNSAGYFFGSGEAFKGSSINISVRLYGGETSAAFNQMMSRIKGLDSEISLTNKDSALTYFNETAEADEPVKISSDTYEIIKLSLEVEEESGGAFSIAAHNLSVLWKLHAEGFRNDAESAKYNAFDDTPLTFELPALNTVQEILSYSSTSLLKLHDNTDDGFYYISKTDKRLKIDLGAVAKGYCADICYSIAKEHNIKSGVIDISGNLYIIGDAYVSDDGRFNPNVQQPWLVGVNAPRPRFDESYIFAGRGDVCAMRVTGDVSVVTSGDYERYYRHETNGVTDITPCHIIDPRTGLPVGMEYYGDEDGSQNLYRMKSGWMSGVTILNTSSALADAYSTTAFVLGFDGAKEFLSARDIKSVIFYDSADAVIQNNSERKMSVLGGLELAETDTITGYTEYTPA